MKYKNPFMLNGHEFNKKPSKDGTLPGDWRMHDGSIQEILSDTSDEPEETVVEEPPEIPIVTKKLSKQLTIDPDEVAEKLR